MSIIYNFAESSILTSTDNIITKIILFVFSWKGAIHWGVIVDESRRFFSSHLIESNDCRNDHGNTAAEASTSYSASPQKKSVKRAVSSFTESALMVDILKTEGYDVIEAAGAGYKILCVIKGVYLFH